jgi:hypothetical protein
MEDEDLSLHISKEWEFISVSMSGTNVFDLHDGWNQQ